MFFKYSSLHNVNLAGQTDKLQASPDRKERCMQLRFLAEEVALGGLF